jgi:hypothetical protein
MHYQGQQKRETTTIQGNGKAGQISTSLSAALYLNGTHGTHHKNRLGLRLMKEIFYQVDSGSLPMTMLQFQSH